MTLLITLAIALLGGILVVIQSIVEAHKDKLTVGLLGLHLLLGALVVMLVSLICLIGDYAQL